MGAILVILIILWILGYIHIPGIPLLHQEIFRVAGHGISIWNILIVLVVMWAIESLPSPLRQIAYVLAVLWVLSLVGIIAISGLSNILVFALIIGLIVSLFHKQ